MGGAILLTALQLSSSAAQEPPPEPLELRFLRPDYRVVDPPLPRAAGGFAITLDFQGGLTPSQQATFEEARADWEARIAGYLPGISLTGVTISALSVAIDGPKNVLGSAGPTAIALQNGLCLTVEGEMRFDSDDLPGLEMQGELQEVIEHEIGHVLGIGTLWDCNALYANGSYQYAGSSGLDAWTSSFSGQAAAPFVPVEDDGGAGTADMHWNENLYGFGEVGISDPGGHDMRFELMTGWLNTPTFYSILTHRHLEDLGFVLGLFAPRRVFDDGFEDGGLTAWSLSEP